MADPTPTVGGTLRGVVETVHAPTFSGPSVRILCDGGFVIPQPFTRPATDPEPDAAVSPDWRKTCRCGARFAGKGRAACPDCTAAFLASPEYAALKATWAAATFAAIDDAAGDDPDSLFVPPEPPVLDLSAHGGSLAAAGARGRAIIANRLGWDGDSGPCPKASAAALIARLTAGDTEPDADPYVVHGDPGA